MTRNEQRRAEEFLEQAHFSLIRGIHDLKSLSVRLLDKSDADEIFVKLSYTRDFIDEILEMLTNKIK